MNKASEIETIVACATGAVRAGVSIVRLSGPLSGKIYEALTRKKLPEANKAVYMKLFDQEGAIIDQCLAISFQAPRSFTGENLVEFHTHGSPYIVEQVILACLKQGAVYANPGQFSERAFLNGKMDLTQAESIADLINSQTKAQASAALSSLNGAFSDKVRHLQASLSAIRTQLEASIDFSEQDIDASSWGGLLNAQRILKKESMDLIEKVRRAIHTASGLRIVIVGRPNAGKSSLLNELTQKDSAIVTDIPGTTRDILKASITHKGCLLEVIDTAGLRKSDDPIEIIGVKKAYDAINRADVIWLLFDASKNEDEKKEGLLGLLEQDRHKDVIVVANKTDLLKAPLCMKKQQVNCQISAKKGENIEKLLDMTIQKQGDWVQSEFSARERHLKALERFVGHLDQSITCSQAQMDLAAEDLRYAQEQLSVITGEYHNEDLLDSIFGTFCLGK